MGQLKDRMFHRVIPCPHPSHQSIAAPYGYCERKGDHGEKDLGDAQITTELPRALETPTKILATRPNVGQAHPQTCGQHPGKSFLLGPSMKLPTMNYIHLERRSHG